MECKAMAADINALERLFDRHVRQDMMSDAMHIRRAIAELSANREAGAGVNVGAGWQPIETAPKAGVRILAWSYNDGDFIGACIDGTWLDDHDAPCAPTHWQPLPDLPSSVGVKVGVSAPSVEPAA
jgi:hypothetical protein